MNPFEMVVAIVVVVTICCCLRSHLLPDPSFSGSGIVLILIAALHSPTRRNSAMCLVGTCSITPGKGPNINGTAVLTYHA